MAPAWRLGGAARCCAGTRARASRTLRCEFMALPGDGELSPLLVADDQVFVEARRGTGCSASPPPTIAGKIEVRGLGIMEVPFLAEAELVLVCDLVGEQGRAANAARSRGTDAYRGRSRAAR